MIHAEAEKLPLKKTLAMIGRDLFITYISQIFDIWKYDVII